MFRIPIRWAIVTPEYPPHCGGVGDYAWHLTGDLAARGGKVGLWVYRAQSDSAAPPPGVTLHAGSPGCGLNHWLPQWRAFHPDIVLVQYTPHGYGWKAMNLDFCRALFCQRQNFEIWTMFHEVAYPLAPGQSWRHQLLAHANRKMAQWVARSSRKIFISISAWTELLESCLGYPFNLSPDGSAQPAPLWLPVPSNLPEDVNAAEAAAVRTSLGLGPQTLLAGHFGTYGAHIAPLLPGLLLGLAGKFPELHFLLLGDGSERWAHRFLAGHPHLAPRVHATGRMASLPTAEHIAACDLLLQPYPDGVSCRRGSAMAGLALGRAIVTNSGPLSEPLWAAGLVELAPHPEDISEYAGRLLADPVRSQRLAKQGRQYYQMHFSRACLARTLSEFAQAGRRPQAQDQTSGA